MSNNDLINAKYAAELQFIQNALKEADFTAQFVDASSDIPMPLLIVTLPQDEKGRERFIHLLFVPVNEEDLKTVQFLQFYSLLPVPPGNYPPELTTFILAANNQIALGHLGYDPNGGLSYRYVHVKEKYRMIDAALVQEMLEVFYYILDSVSPLVEQVAAGQISAAEAMKRLTA